MRLLLLLLPSVSAAGLDLSSEQRLDAPTPYAGLQLGYSLGSAGDLNGDGYGDLVAGADAMGEPISASGAAYLWFGSDAGLGGVRVLRAADAVSGDSLGDGLPAHGGDVDGDGFDDLVVGASMAGEDYEGAVYLFPGAADGPDGAEQYRWELADAQPGDRFGASLDFLGDVDGDGLDDLVAGVYGRDMDGGAYLLFGGEDRSALDTLRIDPEGSGANFLGVGARRAGDVNGDGLLDFFLSDTNSGRESADHVWVYYGDGTRGAPVAEDLALPDHFTREWYGADFDGGGDVDGDGYADLVAAAPYEWEGGHPEGAVYVLFGAAGGADPSNRLRLTSPDRSLSDWSTWLDVAFVPDQDGDGADELLVGARDTATTGMLGSALLYAGGAGGPDPDAGVPFAPGSPERGAFFGQGVLGLPDVNGDGVADLAVGAWNSSAAASGAGGIYVWNGCTDEACTPLCTDEDADGVCVEDDCDDADAGVFPGAEEVCNGVDDNCDGAVDEGVTVRAFRDADRDGYGTLTRTAVVCVVPSGWASAAGDCNDRAPGVHPGATEICGDGIDQDCNRRDAVCP